MNQYLESISTNKTSDNIFTQLNMNSHEEYQYLHLLEHILENGVLENGRNGNTKSIFGASMRFSLANNAIPILTTKKTAWKTCLKELLWFIRGETNNAILQEQGVHIWDANSTREFLDSRGLTHYPENIIGAGYGFQWRHFNAPYDYLTGMPSTNNDADANNDTNNSYKGIDQLQQIIDALKDPTQRNSRRLILSSWNPCQLDEMALPPCHILCQFSVKNDTQLSCALYQRSCDVPLGSPFNIASYSLLTHLLANMCGLEAHEFIYFMGDCHIYEEHMEIIKTQLDNKPLPFPTITIKQVRQNINDYQVDDFEIHNYQHYPSLKMKMVA